MTTYTHRKSTFVRTMAGSPLLRMTVAWSMICGQIVLAAPQGAQVVNGQANISQQGDLTQITAGNNAIINYNSFDIASHETVRFIQPNATSRVLNRITGHDPTRIDGSLLANGRVYWVNPAGIYFGNGALVDVGGFFAAASNITNNDFINNVDQFTDATGSVVNYGTIQGDMVHLIGKHVANHGSILSSEGLVSMVAGDDVLLGERNGHFMVKLTGAAAGMADTAGVENTGTIDAGGGKVHLGAGDLYSLVLHDNSAVRANQITVEGGDGGTVDVAGTLDASNTDAGQVGGTVHVLGDDITVAGAQINASGDAGGGEVLIGVNADRSRMASRANVDGDTSIHAQALTSGDGGFVEVSGHQLGFASTTVNLLAADGVTGTLLLDPLVATIGAVDSPDPTDDPFLIDAATLVMNLGTASQVVLADSIINVNSVIDASAVDNNSSLTLTAPTINLNANISTTSMGDLVLVGAANLVKTVTLTTGTGAVKFGGDVALGNFSLTVAGNAVLDADVAFNKTLGGANANLTFNGMLNGPHNLTLNVDGATTFTGAVGGANAGTAIGTGMGAAITIDSTGTTQFVNTLRTNSGISQANTAGAVTFQQDVNIGAGDTATAFNGNIVLNELALMSDGGVTFGDGVGTDSITLNSGPVSIETTDASILFNANTNINGAQDLTLNSGTAATTINGSVGSNVIRLTGLDITADQVVIGSNFIRLASGKTAAIRPASADQLIALGSDDAMGILGLTGAELDQFLFTLGDGILEIGGLTHTGGISIAQNITLANDRTDTLKLITQGGVNRVDTFTLAVGELALNVGADSTLVANILRLAIERNGADALTVDLTDNTSGLTIGNDVAGIAGITLGAGDTMVLDGTGTITEGTIASPAITANQLTLRGVGTFGTSGNPFGLSVSTLAVDSTSSVYVTNDMSLDLAASSVGGILSATATMGNLTDSGTVDVNSNAIFKTDATGADITLDQLDVNGTVKLTTVGATGNATVVNATGLNLATLSNVGGMLDATATTGNLTDQSTLTVGGNAKFTTAASNADITLNGLAATGTVSVNTTGATGNATVFNTTELNLAASSVGGMLNARATTGNLIDSGTVNVDGNAEFRTNASNADIHLDQLAVDGAVKLTTTGATGNATVVNATALDLTTLSNVGGNLNATATTGNLTDIGTLTVGGDATFTTLASGADIDLDGLSSSIDSVAVNTTGVDGDATIRKATGLILNNSNVGGDLTLIVNDLAFVASEVPVSIVSGGVTAIEPFSQRAMNLGTVGVGLRVDLSLDDLAHFDDFMAGQGLRIGNINNTLRITVSDLLHFDTLGLFTKTGVTVAAAPEGAGTGMLNANRLAIHNTGSEGVNITNLDVNELAVHTAGAGGITINNTGGLVITEVTGLTGLKTVNRNIDLATTGSLTFSANVGDGVDAVVSTGTNGTASFTAGGAITDVGTAPMMIGGAATFATHSGGDFGTPITLNNESSSFGAITAQSLRDDGISVFNGNIEIVENGDMNLALVQTNGTGTFTATNGGMTLQQVGIGGTGTFTATNGAITDSNGVGDVVTIGGAASFVTQSSGMGENITLTNDDSTFGAITAQTLDEDGGDLPGDVVSGAIDITEAASMVLASVKTTSTASFHAIDSIVDSGTLRVEGDVLFEVSRLPDTTNPLSIVINSSTNTFGAIAAHIRDSVGATADGSITIIENAAMELDSVQTLGNSTFQSNTGGITDSDSGLVRSGGLATFVTRGVDANVMLDSLDVGTVNLDTVGNAEITADNLNVIGFVRQALTAESPVGALTINGNLTVLGLADLTAETVNVTGTDFIVTNFAAQGGAMIHAADVNITNNNSRITGFGKLDFLPTTVDRSIGVAATTGGFDLTAVEIGRIQGNFDMITFGREIDGEHAITIGAVTFNDPVTFQTPNMSGSITVNGQITGLGDASVTLIGSGATTTLNAGIQTEGNMIKIDDRIQLGESSLIVLDNTLVPEVGEFLLLDINIEEGMAGDIRLLGDVSDTGETSSGLRVTSVNDIVLNDVIIGRGQDYSAEGTITLNSTAYKSTKGGGITYATAGGVILNDDVMVETADGDILFAGTIDGDQSLTLKAGVTGAQNTITGNGSIALLQAVGFNTEINNGINGLDATAADEVIFGQAVNSSGAVKVDAMGGNLHVHDITVNTASGITLFANPNSLITISSTLSTQGGAVEIGRDIGSVPAFATIAGRSDLFSQTPTDITINTNGGIFQMGQNQKITANNISISTLGMTSNGGAFVGDIGAVGNLILNLGSGSTGGRLSFNRRNPSTVFTIANGFTRDRGVDLVAGGVLRIMANGVVGTGPNIRPVLASPSLDISRITSVGVQSIALGTTNEVFTDFVTGLRVLDLTSGGGVTDLAISIPVLVPPQDAEIAAVPDEENLEIGEKELLRRIGIPAEDLTAEQLLAIATGEGLPWLIDDIGSPDDEAGEHIVTVVRMLKRAVPAALALYKTIYISDEIDEEGRAVSGSKSQRIREVLTQAWIDYSVSGAEADSVDLEQYLRTAPDTEEAWTYVVLLRALFDQLEIMGLTDRELAHTKFVLLEREGIIPKGMTLTEFEELLFGSQAEVVSAPTGDDLLSLHPLEVQDTY